MDTISESVRSIGAGVLTLILLGGVGWLLYTALFDISTPSDIPNFASLMHRPAYVCSVNQEAIPDRGIMGSITVATAMADCPLAGHSANTIEKGLKPGDAVMVTHARDDDYALTPNNPQLRK